MRYRRASTPGATYFFTVVTYQRQRIFQDADAIAVLRAVFGEVKASLPFEIDAIALLPDHLHCIWTLPEGDADFSMRWRLIKGKFSRSCPVRYQREQSESRQCKGEKAVWQRRFWEHQIRDEADFSRHVDYVHYNPVRHGLVDAPKDWSYSSFHRAVSRGIYPIDWGSNEAIIFPDAIGHE